MNIVWWIVIGLVAGFIARLVVPGGEGFGVLGTIVLGIVGSFVGGFLGSLFYEGNADIQPSGLIGSIIGAIVALLIYRAMNRRGAHV